MSSDGYQPCSVAGHLYWLNVVLFLGRPHKVDPIGVCMLDALRNEALQQRISMELAVQPKRSFLNVFISSGVLSFCA